MSWPWDALGLSGPAGLPDIRRAYAQALKGAHPEEDPEGFQRLHSAYQLACRLARQGKTPESNAPSFPASIPPVNDAAGAASDSPAAREAAFFPKVEETAPVFAPASTVPAADALGTHPPAGDWDYDRLFSEAEEDLEAARRRAYQARLRQAASLLSRIPGKRPDDGARAVVLQALFLLEENPPLGGWRLNCWVLLHNPGFLSMKDDRVFVRCVERFFREHPQLPQEVRDAFFRAYGFHQRGLAKWKHWRLCLLLAGDEVRTMWRLNAQAALLLVLVLASLLFFLVRSLTWQARVGAWLEEDFGRAFHALRTENGIFVPDDAPDLRFHAVRSGRRDPEAGKRGYVTDYTAVLLGRELAAFAQARGDAFTQSEGFRFPVEYTIRVPLTGAGGDLSALGERLASLEQEAWYRELPPEYVLSLCWRGWCFHQYRSGGEDALDADAARAFYETELGPALCALLARDTGAAARNLGADAVLTPQGTLSLQGETFFRAWGFRRGEEVLAAEAEARGTVPRRLPRVRYLLSSDGGDLFCLSAPPRSLSDVYAGTPERVEAGGDALNVWDRVQAETGK